MKLVVFSPAENETIHAFKREGKPNGFSIQETLCGRPNVKQIWAKGYLRSMGKLIEGVSPSCGMCRRIMAHKARHPIA